MPGKDKAVESAPSQSILNMVPGLPPELAAALVEHASAEGVPPAGIIARALAAYSPLAESPELGGMDSAEGAKVVEEWEGHGSAPACVGFTPSRAPWLLEGLRSELAFFDLDTPGGMLWAVNLPVPVESIGSRLSLSRELAKAVRDNIGQAAGISDLLVCARLADTTDTEILAMCAGNAAKTA